MGHEAYEGRARVFLLSGSSAFQGKDFVYEVVTGLDAACAQHTFGGMKSRTVFDEADIFILRFGREEGHGENRIQRRR
jgi:hypothetical protein